MSPRPVLAALLVAATGAATGVCGGGGAPGAGPASSDDTLFLDADAFEQTATIEIVPAASAGAARDALVSALEAIRTVEGLVDPESAGPRGVAALNRAAGQGKTLMAPPLLALLERALSFCVWSQQAHGPLGGELYAAWGLRRPAAALPHPEVLAAAIGRARCERLTLDGHHATLGAGSRVELHGFAEGFAVDQAVAALRAAGVRAGRVRLGSVERAFGDAPAGRGGPGWQVEAHLTERPEPAVRVVLEGQALAVASPRGRSFEVAGDHYPRTLDLRSGRPVGRDHAVVAVTELAIDAQALAVTLLVLGSREGQYRVGGLRPPPAVLFVSALDSASPLEISSGFAALRKWTADGDRP